MGVGVAGVGAGFAAAVELFEDDPEPQAHRTSSRAETSSTSIHRFIGSTIPRGPTIMVAVRKME